MAGGDGESRIGKDTYMMRSLTTLDQSLDERAELYSGHHCL